MGNNKPIIYLAMLLVLAAGVFSIYLVMAEDSPAKTAIAVGNVKTLSDQTANTAANSAKTPGAGPLSFCEQKKVSQTKLNYDSIIYISGNPDEACAGREDLAKYNYQKVDIV